MLDQAAIENALVAWVKARTGLAQGQVILMDQNAPAPKSGKYVGINLGTISRVGRDQQGPTDASGIRQRIGNREMTVAVHAYRLGSREMLDDLADSLDEDPILDTLREAGIVVWDIGDVMNVTLPIEQTIREHYTFELFLRLASQRSETVGYIGQAELQGTLSSAGSVDIVESITIGDTP